MREILTFMFVIMISAATLSQTKISGRVTDAGNQALPGANVFIKDTYDGVSAMDDGSFSFISEETGDAVLVVSYVGYITYEKNIKLEGKDITVDVTLEEDSKEMGTVVISAGAFEASDESKSVMLRPFDIVTTGSDADIYNAMETLPGTQQVGESEGLFVRGGSAAETATIVDEMLVQKPFYSSVPDIPSRGRFSPFLFKGTIFSTGGYSAQYGQALSSALILKTADLVPKTQTSINLMPLGVGGSHAQRWENSSFAFEGGYYNLALYNRIFKQRPDWDKSPIGIELNSNYRVKVSDSGILKAYASYSYGDLSLNMENLDDLSNKENFGLQSDDYYVNVSYRDVWKNDWSFFSGASLSLNKDNIRWQGNNITEDESMRQGKITITKGIFDGSFLTFGGEIQNPVYKDGFNEYSRQLDEIYVAGYVESDIFFSKKLAARIGLRGEHSKILNESNLAPRISLAYKLGEYDQLNFAYGKFYQSPIKDFLMQTTNFAFEDAEHYIFNYQYIGENRTFRIELYYKDYDNLAKGTLYDTYPYIDVPEQPFTNNGSGFAKGIDIFWRDSETFQYTDYWLSYSYLDTKRDFMNYPSMATPTFATPHTFSAVLKHWIPSWTALVGLTYSFATGRPYFNPNNPIFLGDKTKSYNNLTLNVSYLTSIFNSFTIIFFSIDNILGFNNVYGYRYSSDGSIKSPVVSQALRTFFVGVFISVGESMPF